MRLAMIYVICMMLSTLTTTHQANTCTGNLNEEVLLGYNNINNCCTHIGFTLCPSSQVVGIGQKAVFRCQYPTATIVWRWNGTLVNENSPLHPPGVTPNRTVDRSRNVVDFTLTIAAQPDYNETDIVCIAGFTGTMMPDEETTPVNITIQGRAKSSVYCDVQTLTNFDL